MDRNCLETIYDRRSIARFKSDEIPNDVLEKVLRAAARAPAPGGSVLGGYRGAQPYSIIVVRDRKRREQLKEMLSEGRKEAIVQAPVSLIFCVDTHRLNRWAETNGGVPHFRGIGILWVALRAVYTAAQSALLAAETLGLGSQYIQEIVWQPYKTLEFFDLPKHVLPVAMIVMGYPAERPSIAPSLPLEALVHEETYHDPSDEEITRHYSDKEEYFQNWVKALPEDSPMRKHIEAQRIRNLAQYVSRLTYTESFYKWRDDIVRSNLSLSELE